MKKLLYFSHLLCNLKAPLTALFQLLFSKAQNLAVSSSVYVLNLSLPEVDEVFQFLFGAGNVAGLFVNVMILREVAFQILEAIAASVSVLPYSKANFCCSLLCDNSHFFILLPLGSLFISCDIQIISPFFLCVNKFL